jgi:tetratricopeptide (TPR) repeat protein
MSANELYKKADALKDDGKYVEAIETLHEILATEETHVLSHLALAVLYGKVNKHDKAVEHGEKACEVDPSDPFNFTAMSVTYQRAWQGTQQQEFIQKAEDAMAQAHALEAQAG